MSYTLTFGKTKKHPCDTSRLMTDTRVEDVVLKDNVDIKAPIFTVNFDPSNYNYVSWARSDGPTRYYWLDHCVHLHANYYDVYLSLDIMATYRDTIQLGLSGRLLYTTWDSLWDEYFDDLRFSPSSLDIYDYLPWGDDSNNWLHESSNVFGDYDADMWDVTYDADGNITGYGVGCYLAQIQNNSGISTYIFNKNGFDAFMEDMLSMWNTQWTGPFSTVDPRTFIKLCVWMPINVGKLAAKIGSGSYVAQPTWYLGQKTIGTPDISQGEVSYEIPYTSILSFSGSIVVPQNPNIHPIWMENNRWNTLTLNTPSGNTEINLDFMYPIQNNHNRVQFSTIFDVVQGKINTKFTYDVKGHWSNISGTPIYESDFDIGWDIMNLVNAVFNKAQGMINAAMTGAGLAGGAFLGGMAAGSMGAGSGLAKIKAARAMEESGLNLKQNGESIAKTMMNQGIRESTKEIAPIASVAATGIATAKLNPSINNTVCNITNVGDRASIFNTVQMGVVSLRMKPFRCKELAAGPDVTDPYPTPMDKYEHFCEQFGYPANTYINSLYIDGQLGEFYVFEDAHLDLSNIVSTELNGITDEEMKAIEDIAKSGFWYN